MVELAEIFRRHGPAYRAKYAARMLPSHHKVMRAVEACRTAALGGHLYTCTACGEIEYSYHSCKDRHCPKCQNNENTQWLERQKQRLLPCDYFMVTYTLPNELRPLVRSRQRTLYGMLFQTSSSALKKLALDPKYLGAEVGMIGVLQTWARDLSFHPHLHYLVPAGGLGARGDQWRAVRSTDFLVPVMALSKIFRGKMHAAINKAGLAAQVSDRVWKKAWVVHAEPVGGGEEVLKYLTPYIHRIAISNHNIEKLEDGKVTFRYKAKQKGRWEHCTLEAEEFIRRFLQHVLPRRFVKVRYYGILAARNHARRDTARVLLRGTRVAESDNEGAQAEENTAAPVGGRSPHRCRKCGGALRLLKTLLPARIRSPPGSSRC